MDEWMDGWTDGQAGKWMDGWMHEASMVRQMTPCTQELSTNYTLLHRTDSTRLVSYAGQLCSPPSTRQKQQHRTSSQLKLC